MGRNRIVKERQSLSFSTGDVSSPAVNTAAVVTYAAYPGPTGTAGVGNQPVPAGYINPAALPATVSHAINGFRATVDSLTVLAANPVVKIEDGSGNIVYQSHLQLSTDASSTGRALYFLEEVFPQSKKGTAGNALIITMPANGANTTNRLSILGHWTELA